MTLSFLSLLVSATFAQDARDSSTDPDVPDLSDLKVEATYDFLPADLDPDEQISYESRVAVYRFDLPGSCQNPSWHYLDGGAGGYHDSMIGRSGTQSLALYYLRNHSYSIGRQEVCCQHLGYDRYVGLADVVVSSSGGDYFAYAGYLVCANLYYDRTD